MASDISKLKYHQQPNERLLKAKGAKSSGLVTRIAPIQSSGKD